MPEDLEHDDLDPDDGGGGDSIVRLPRKDIRALEKKGKAYDDVAARAATLERDLAFARAGVDTSTDEGAFFARGYDGELDAAAIKAAAQRFNVLAPGSVPAADPANPSTFGDPSTPPRPDPSLEPGEADLTSARQALSAGAAGESPVDLNPFDQAIEIGRRVQEEGGKFEQALGSAINFLANAANQGDRRVIIDRKSLQAVGFPTG